MIVRLTTTITGTRNGQPWPQRGGTIDVPDREGASLIQAGLAVRVEVAPIVEAATADDSDAETTDADDSDVETTTDTAPVETAAAAPRPRTRRRS